MKRGAIEKALRNFGLSEKEAEAYIFLGKRGPLKAREITKHLKMNKGQVYRILKNLQKKGLVEATLEFPTRFTALPFKDVIDAFIKSKREEVVQIEETKKDLLSDWKNISQTELDSSLEKFSVIEGNKKIFYKISQMIKEANTQFAIALTVSDLLKAERFGLFNFSYDKTNIEFRILTQLSKQNLKAMKFLKPKLKSKIAIRVTNPSLGASRFSRMAIRDNDGFILFISDKNKQSLNDAKEVCLSTNCKSIIEAFLGAFEDFWKDSTDIDDRICEIETGKLTPKTYIINDAKEAHKKYHEIINSTNKEIIISTSTKGLVACYKDMDYIRTWIKKGVSVKIMAPIVSENMEAAQQLSNLCEIRHIPPGHLGTTIVDGKHLFQFKTFPLELEAPATMKHFEKMFYTNDHDYVEKTRMMLTNVWKNAFAPSPTTLSVISRIEESDVTSRSDKKMITELQKIQGLDSKDERITSRFTEKELLNRFINAKRVPVKDLSKDPVTFYCSAGQAVIHPPPSFGLPHMLFHIFHLNKKSAFGAEDAMIILYRHKTPSGYIYLPAAFITDNPNALVFWRHTFAGIPFKQEPVKKDEFYVQIQHNTLFAGWTVPIPLPLQQQILPPSCIIIEGYGNVKTGKYSINEPSGDTIINQVNYFEAFVTFMHPESKYTGPGTDGYFFREFLSTTYPSSIT